MFLERVDERPRFSIVRGTREDLDFAGIERDGDASAVGTPSVTRDRLHAETERFRHLATTAGGLGKEETRSLSQSSQSR